MPSESDESLIGEPAGEELAPGVRAPAGAVRIQFSRGSGPGGQNVNKVNTRVEIWVAVARLTGITPAALWRLRTAAGNRLTAADEIHLSSDAQRSQEQNKSAVFQRLRELIIAARIEPKRRRKTKPSRAAKLRRLESKKHRSGIKQGRRSGPQD
jgi:ribosome-associated protein